MITNYSNRPMTCISQCDYDTLIMHLSEQLTGAMCREGWPRDGETIKAVEDALNNEWLGSMTATEWLHAAGKRLAVDTSFCVGI